MNTQATLRQNPGSHARSLWSWRSLPWLACAAVVAWSLHLLLQPAPVSSGADAQATGSVPAVVQWKDASHDWLLVVDQATHELVIYDAISGRPLRRLGGSAAPIDSIAGEGDWLIATSQQGPHLQVLSLPELRPVTLAAR